MDFRLTPDQIELRDTVRDYLSGEHGPETLRRLDAQGGRDPAIWQGLADMGLTGLLVPEAQGGLGLGLVEAALVAIELGRANVSEPIVDTALVAVPWLLAHEGAKLLPEIAAGTAKVALGHPVNPWVADLDQAQVVIAGSGWQPKAEGMPVRLETVDPLRRLFACNEAVPNDRLLDLSALMATAQMIGAAERMLSLATDYAQQREQFGQPIGAFQAIKHHLATVAVKIEFARPLLLRAAWAMQAGQFRAPVQVSMAKLAATDAATFAAETAIQVHGAMGYTYEVDLHYWMKRVWALAGAWGDRAFHLRHLDDAVIGGGMAIGPDQTFESELAHG